jgi:SAM-dependent methyltransferase
VPLQNLVNGIDLVQHVPMPALRDRVAPIVDLVAPPLSTRRLALNIAKRPAAAKNRLRAHNLKVWRDVSRTPMQCNICGHVARPYHGLPDPTDFETYRIAVIRETVLCRHCRSTMRWRTVASGLLDVMASRFDVRAATIPELAAQWPAEVKVLDTDRYNSINERLAGAPGYLRSVYLDDTANGEQVDEGVYNVDLQDMPFPDDEFDIIITTEVMEHVRHVDVAHREIARCLKPGGTYLFTVPYDETFERTWQLIDPLTDEPLVLPMHIHGDAIRGGIKSYRVFGRDILDDLREAGLSARFLRVDRPDVGLYGGDLFVAEKA